MSPVGKFGPSPTHNEPTDPAVLSVRASAPRAIAQVRTLKRAASFAPSHNRRSKRTRVTCPRGDTASRFKPTVGSGRSRARCRSGPTPSGRFPVAVLPLVEQDEHAGALAVAAGLLSRHGECPRDGHVHRLGVSLHPEDLFLQHGPAESRLRQPCRVGRPRVSFRRPAFSVAPASGVASGLRRV